MPVADLSADVLLGAAALLLSLAGVIATVAGVRSGRKDATAKAESDCHERLLKEQRVSEELSNQLHDLKMGAR